MIYKTIWELTELNIDSTFELTHAGVDWKILSFQNGIYVQAYVHHDGFVRFNEEFFMDLENGSLDITVPDNIKELLLKNKS